MLYISNKHGYKMQELPDIQSSLDQRNIIINKVGVKDIKFPVNINTANNVLSSVANIDMYVRLPADAKGTHMSRFLQILQEVNDTGKIINFDSMQELMTVMLEKLEAQSGYIRIATTYFIEKIAPVSKVKSIMDYQLAFEAEVIHGNTKINVKQEVIVPVKSLCPCSKQISKYGAHNQRSHIYIKALLNRSILADELIKIAEQQASCELWSILKRADEKYVTETAYENPKFVEDLVRDIAVELNQHSAVDSYELSSENFESIHNHSAYAFIEHSKIKA
jgi:GTP cyclohydrolase IB